MSDSQYVVTETQEALRRKWTVGVYLGGDTSLRQPMVLALKEMYRVGVTTNLNVVAQLNMQDAFPRRFTLSQACVQEPATHRNVASTQCRAVSQVDSDGRLGSYSEEISSLGEIPRGMTTISSRQANVNQQALQDFVVSTIKRYPRDRFMLILSGHGNGAIGSAADPVGYCPGGIFTHQLESTFALITDQTGLAIDILGLDSCYMSMVEVCWALRGKAQILIASEGPAPNIGWPFHRILESLQCTEDMDANRLANAVVDSHLRYYSDYVLAGESVDLSACNLEALDELSHAIRELGDVLQAKLASKTVQDALIIAHWKAQSYKQDQYVDLWDFCDVLQQRDVDPYVSSACQRVKSAVSLPGKGVVQCSIYSGAESQHSHGLSIYFPWAEVSKNYSELGFGEATGWTNFLERYIDATRREMRVPPKRWPSSLVPTLNSIVETKN